MQPIHMVQTNGNLITEDDAMISVRQYPNGVLIDLVNDTGIASIQMNKADFTAMLREAGF